MGLLPIQDPRGCVWLSQNVPINLLSCFFFAVIDSYGTDRLLLLQRGKGRSQTELLSGGTWVVVVVGGGVGAL